MEHVRGDSLAARLEKGGALSIDEALGAGANLPHELADLRPDRLDEAINATDPAKRTELVNQARQEIARYQAFIAGDSLFSRIDTNPFVPLSTSKILTSTLATLGAAVH